MSKTEEEIPFTILTDKEKLQGVIEMFKSKLVAEQERLDAMKSSVSEQEKVIEFLKKKTELLSDYFTFLEHGGFHEVRQTVDANAEEIKRAQTSRMNEDNGFQFTGFSSNDNYIKCGKPIYISDHLTSACVLPAGHMGECSIVG